MISLVDAAETERVPIDVDGFVRTLRGMVSLSVDEAVLRQRIQARSGTGGDASEAGTAVLEYQLSLAEPLDDRELRDAIVVGEQPESAVIAQQIKADQTEQ